MQKPRVGQGLCGSAQPVILGVSMNGDRGVRRWCSARGYTAGGCCRGAWKSCSLSVASFSVRRSGGRYVEVAICSGVQWLMRTLDQVQIRVRDMRLVEVGVWVG